MSKIVKAAAVGGGIYLLYKFFMPKPVAASTIPAQEKLLVTTSSYMAADQIIDDSKREALRIEKGEDNIIPPPDIGPENPHRIRFNAVNIPDSAQGWQIGILPADGGPTRYPFALLPGGVIPVNVNSVETEIALDEFEIYFTAFTTPPIGSPPYRLSRPQPYLKFQDGFSAEITYDFQSGLFSVWRANDIDVFVELINPPPGAELWHLGLIPPEPARWTNIAPWGDPSPIDKPKSTRLNYEYSKPRVLTVWLYKDGKFFGDPMTWGAVEFNENEMGKVIDWGTKTITPTKLPNISIISMPR